MGKGGWSVVSVYLVLVCMVFWYARVRADWFTGIIIGK